MVGGRLPRRLFEAPDMARHVVGEFKPGKDVQSDDEWTDYIRSTAMGIYHPASTCKMGLIRWRWSTTL